MRQMVSMDFDFTIKEDIDRLATRYGKGKGWNALFWCNHDQLE